MTSIAKMRRVAECLNTVIPSFTWSMVANADAQEGTSNIVCGKFGTLYIQLDGAGYITIGIEGQNGEGLPRPVSMRDTPLAIAIAVNGTIKDWSSDLRQILRISRGL